jgi:hypothetical protein
MTILRTTYTLLILSLFTFTLAAQKGTVRGYVYDKESGEPIGFGNVYLEGTTKGTNTDFEGFYNLSDVPVGEYTLVATFLGYDTASVDIKVFDQGIVNQTLYLTEGGISLGVINVSAERTSRKTEVQVSKITVSAKQIKALPSVGGEADIAQYLQVLPGVVSTGDQGGQIYIRGGSPVQNKIILDGLNIYNPFHSLGFFSVFETDLIRNVDVFTGGFNAEYGGRVSAIVDIKTREGKRTGLGGYASISPFMGKAMIEGPIQKFKEGSGSTSFVLTGKKSIIDNTSKTLYRYAAQDEDVGLPFFFNDIYGKVTHITSGGSKFNVFGFNFDDQYNDPSIADIGWTNSGFGTSFSLIPATSNLIIDGVIGSTNYNIGIDEAGDDRSSDIREFGANIDFTFFGTKSEFKYGLALLGMRTNFDFRNPFGIRLRQEQNTTEVSTYFKFNRKWEKLIIEPSIRIMYYASQRVFSPEPRLGVKFNFTDRIRFKAAGGLYSQNVLSAASDKDVVNLFSGFLTGPEGRLTKRNGERLEDNLQRARHLVGGFEFDLFDNLLLNVEGYLKDYNQLIAINRNKVLASESDYAFETGEAYGAEFSAKYETPKYYLWATYTYGIVNRDDGEQVFPTVFDRRHNLNLLGTYNIDEKGDFQVSIRWNLGTGFPFTQTKGFYTNINFLEGVTTDYLTSNPDNIGIIFSETRNGGRLPAYHRLDLSVNKKFYFSNDLGMEANVSVTNVYDRPNIFYFDRVRYLRVNQLPVLPSAGIKFFF